MVFAAALIAGACSKSGDDGGYTPVKPGGRYPVTVAVGPEDGGSRAIFDGTNYYWQSSGDQIGLSVATTGSSSFNIAHNMLMTNNASGNTLSTTFTGGFTQAQIDAMQPDAKYDYYSYFPYDGSGSAATFPNVRVMMPAVISLKTNEFSSTYAPMVGSAVLNADAITYLEGGTQINSEPIRFTYQHVMSYAAFEMDVDLINQPITRVEVITMNGTPVSGGLNVNVTNGTASWTSPSNSLTIDIADGGMIAGSGSVIYIPILPGNLSEEQFLFRLTGTDSRNKYRDIIINGTNFERGKIHRLRMAQTATSITAEYTVNMNFTSKKDGFYFVEAWGGNGGSG